MYMYLVNRFGGMEAFDNAQARKARFDSEPMVKAAQLYQEWAKRVTSVRPRWVRPMVMPSNL